MTKKQKQKLINDMRELSLSDDFAREVSSSLNTLNKNNNEKRNRTVPSLNLMQKTYNF